MTEPAEPDPERKPEPVRQEGEPPAGAQPQPTQPQQPNSIILKISSDGSSAGSATPAPSQSGGETVSSISLANAITLLGLIVAGLVGVYQLYVIPVAKSELDTKLELFKKQSQEDAKANESKQATLLNRIAQLEDARARLLEAGTAPILLYPKSDETIISNEITFRWDYKSEQIPHFIIEIVRLPNNGLRGEKYSVLQPQNRVFHLPITEKDAGQFLWRVKPGIMLEDYELATGPWSAYQSFSVFTSVQQKVVDTRRLTVGMYPSFTDKFNSPVAGGKYEGLSVDLARFIAGVMTDKFPNDSLGQARGKIVVEIKSLSWQDLLRELARNSVDVVISSVTATKKREDDFGIRFSKGYYVTKQMFLANQLPYNSKRDLFTNLRKKRIGVVKGTTNERAAFYLSEKCNCDTVVKADYLQLIEAKNALFERDVDLLLTDNIWLTGESNLGTFVQWGPSLDKILSKFYTGEYGRPQEEYGVAVPRKGGDEILKTINEILDEDKAKQFLEAVKARMSHP